MMQRKIKWFLHPQHGYMARGVPFHGWQTVVTALCLNTRDVEDDAALWKAHKDRLHVNAGSGAVAVDEMRVGDHNPAFRPVAASRVPAHIRNEFAAFFTCPEW